MSLDHSAHAVHPRLEQIKRDIFGAHPDEPIILHRKDIISKNAPFAALRDPFVQARFDTMLMSLLGEASYSVITVVIDKLEHKNRYKVWRYDPYHYCLEMLLERYVRFLDRKNAQGNVMAEVRGKNPDKRLKRAFETLYNRGTTYLKPQVFQARLTSGELKLKPKTANIAGLQIADLLAHPSAGHLKHVNAGAPAPNKFSAPIVQLLRDHKYERSSGGRVEGYGTKWLSWSWLVGQVGSGFKVYSDC